MGGGSAPEPAGAGPRSRPLRNPRGPVVTAEPPGAGQCSELQAAPSEEVLQRGGFHLLGHLEGLSLRSTR